MKNKVINALLEVGIPANIKGFEYITDAVCMLDEEKWKDARITIMYKEIAKRHEKTASRVERAMRHAFSIAVAKGSDEAVQKYLTKINLTNANLIHVLHIRLVQEAA